jgi:hypothetical protein
MARSTRTRRFAVTTALIVAAALAAVLSTEPARGAQSATATATINVLIKSVTLSTSKLTYGNCKGGHSTPSSLGFPWARCTTGPVVVTNGDASAGIAVSGSTAVPSDGGTAWTLCGGAGNPACPRHQPQPTRPRPVPRATHRRHHPPRARREPHLRHRVRDQRQLPDRRARAERHRIAHPHRARAVN